MPKQGFKNEVINAAIEGFEGQKKRIDEQIRELRAMLSGGRVEPAATTEAVPGKRRKRSAVTLRSFLPPKESLFSD